MQAGLFFAGWASAINDSKTIFLFSCLLLLSPIAASESEQREVQDPRALANFLIIKGKFTEAEKLIRWVLMQKTVPEQQKEELQYFLGLALSGQKKHALAIEIFRSILDRHPQETKVRLILGRLLYLVGNDAAAKRQIDLVLADFNFAETRLAFMGNYPGIRANVVSE